MITASFVYQKLATGPASRRVHGAGQLYKPNLEMKASFGTEGQLPTATWCLMAQSCLQN